jgi:hypothetical protein
LENWQVLKFWSLIMKATMIDPIVAEVRAVRDKHAAKFGHDLNKIFRDIKARQDASGRKFVKYPPRNVAAWHNKRIHWTFIPRASDPWRYGALLL